MVEASPVEVKNAKFWINEGFARPRKTINKRISSYGLKPGLVIRPLIGVSGRRCLRRTFS